MTNEPTLLPLAPHSEGCEFPELDPYRGIVEEAVFDRLGRPSFFDQVVDLILSRIAARVGQQGSAGTLCAFAPQLSEIRELAQQEVRKLRDEIESKFVETGKIELPAER